VKAPIPIGGARARGDRLSRVLIMTENQPVPPDRRVLAEARALAQAGHTVSVICPLGPGQETREVADGILFLRYTPAPSGGGVLGYVLEYANCLIRTAVLTAHVLMSPGFDVIHACNPPDLFVLIAGGYKVLGKRFVFDQHDLVPELFESKFGSRRTLLYRMLCLAERVTYWLADVAIVTNESYAEIARDRGRVLADRVFVVRNGPEAGWPERGELREALRSGRQYLVLYLGVMGPQDGVDVLLAAIHEIVHRRGRRDVLFALLGDGDSREDLRVLAEKLDIADSIHMPGWVNDDRLLWDFLATSDLFVCPEPSSPLNDRSTFIKVVEYMAAERPIVAFDLPETRYSAGGCALYIEPGDTLGFADAVLELLGDPQRRRSMSAIARERVQGFRWESQARILEQAYRLVDDQ
jgi:glycosyltransferase involved in cell wall biosynthesis